MSHRVAGLLLAAGSSRRMGRPKQLVVVGGRALLAQAVETALDARLDALVLVLGHAAQEIRAALPIDADARLRVVVNAAYREGVASSLRAGLAALPEGTTHVAVLLADQPTLSSATVRRVVAEALDSGAWITRPVWREDGEVVPGHPVVLSGPALRELASLEGDVGARALVARHPEWVHELSMPGAPPPDVDRPGDLDGPV